MKVLVDGDILLYRIGYTTQEDPPWIAKARIDDLINSIIVNTNADSQQIYLSDSTENCFRIQLYPQYKANRKSEKPVHYEFLKEYLITYWDAQICPELEADDKLGIEQDKKNKSTIIATIDKDLKQIPGNHYHFVDQHLYEVTPFQGLLYFYTQILVGDTSDNIKGCWKIGPKLAARWLANCNDELSMFSTILKLYKRQHPEEEKNATIERLRIVGQLVKIMQHEDEGLWDFPVNMETVDKIWESCSVV